VRHLFPDCATARFVVCCSERAAAVVLSREQNATLLAFILNANQFPAGAAELSTDGEKLRQIRFEATKQK